MGNFRQAFCALVLLASACSQPTTALMPPPLAGLWHPAAVRPGQSVVLDASTTAIGAPPADDPGIGGSRVTSYHFEIATFPAVDSAYPSLAWSFPDPGHYALRLVVTDDLGRQSSVDSSIDVVTDLADACTGTIADGCASGACAAGQCATFACAGDQACPVVNGRALVCDASVCAITTATLLSGDVYGGDDVGVIAAPDSGSP